MHSLRSPDVPWIAILALAAGAAIRLGALSLPGTNDLGAFKTWSYAAATDGPAHVYGHGFPPERHVLKFGEREAIANYPPLAIDELALIGRIYWIATDGAFPDGPALTMTIKGAIVLADLAMATLLFGAIWKMGGRRAAWWSAAAYWISPAVLVTTTLGYIDVFFALPAVGALIAASSGQPAAAGALFAAALMTKPQALFVAPAIALALWNVGGATAATARLLAAVKSAAIVAAVLVLPVVFAGTTVNMLRALATIVRHDMLSGNAFNVWWIVGYLIQVVEASERGVLSPVSIVAGTVPISAISPAWYPGPRVLGGVLTLAAAGWALRTARHARDLGLFAALAAFMVHAYFLLSAQVHENHFYVAIPLLVLAATLRPQFTPILTTLGIVFALNLYLFYGIGGENPPDIARTFTIVDSTVLLSIVNVAVFVQFAMIFRGVCREGPGAPTSFAPAQAHSSATKWR